MLTTMLEMPMNGILWRQRETPVKMREIQPLLSLIRNRTKFLRCVFFIQGTLLFQPTRSVPILTVRGAVLITPNRPSKRLSDSVRFVSNFQSKYLGTVQCTEKIPLIFHWPDLAQHQKFTSLYSFWPKIKQIYSNGDDSKRR